MFSLTPCTTNDLSLSPTPLADILDEVEDADSDEKEAAFEVPKGFIKALLRRYLGSI